MSVRLAAAMSFKRSTGRQVLSVVVENVRVKVLLIPRGRSAMVACTRRWCGAPSIVPDGHEAAEGGRQVVAEISGEVLACAFRRRLATDGLRETRVVAQMRPCVNVQPYSWIISPHYDSFVTALAGVACFC